MDAQDRVYVVGRADDCDVVLADKSVSRRHAELQPLDDGSIFLVDRASRNGTAVIVDGERPRRIRQEVVSPDAVLELGRVRIRAGELLERAGAPIRRRGRGGRPGAPDRREPGAGDDADRRRDLLAKGRHLERCERCGAVKARNEPCRECAE